MRLRRYYGRLRHPADFPTTSQFSLVIGWDPSEGFPQPPPGRRGLLQFLSVPSERSAPHTPGSSSGLPSRFFTPSVAFALSDQARLSLLVLTTRQASLHATDRSVAPPKGLLTLGFDQSRFPLQPPVCYRASWHLPGPDFHRLEPTSLCWFALGHHRLPTLDTLTCGLPGRTEEPTTLIEQREA